MPAPLFLETIMLGDDFAAILVRLGFTHVIHLPDSVTGQWDAALARNENLMLIRPTREGEAIGIAAGLILGGRSPLVMMQCTGFFEAGDAFRNVVHDLKLPLRLVIGVRSYQAFQKGASNDTCPRFIERILEAWQLPFEFLPISYGPADFETKLSRLLEARRAGALLIPE
jgi:sulfopyruvate decarboxylase TPP-binding subunit